MSELPPNLRSDRVRSRVLNPYLDLHRALGPPVIPAEQAPGFRGRWEEAFGRTAPLHVEVGSGNGDFLAAMAARHRAWNWLGLEIRYKRVVLCARRLTRAAPDHARIARWDAWRLVDILAPGEAAGLYINHPDPWPKEKQAKKRLLGPGFLRQAAEVLRPGAELRLKTDFPGNVELLLASIAGLPFAVLGRSEDIRLDGAPWGEDEVSNYQRKFDARGVAVHAVWLRRVDAD